MVMKRREKILAGATGAVLVAFAGVSLFSGGGRSLSELRKEREGLQKNVEMQTAQAHPGIKASEQLARWRQRSLPSDPADARRLYTEWLTLAVDRVKLRSAKITPSPPRAPRGIYTILPFSIDGQGTWDQLTRFLFDFYSVDYLHKVAQLTITPIKDSQDLTLVISIEALCLAGAVHQDKLPEGKPKRLESSKLDDYLKAIVRRRMEGERFADSGGLFAAYAPEQRAPPQTNVARQPPPQSPKFDPSEHTYVNAINDVDGLPEVWLFVRTEGKTLVLHEGDPFEVGTISGKIARIRLDELDVEVVVDGGRHFRIDFGDNLHQRVELPE
jgi:hypothetical protein